MLAKFFFDVAVVLVAQLIIFLARFITKQAIDLWRRLRHGSSGKKHVQ